MARIINANEIKAIHGYKVPRVIYGRSSIVSPNKLQRVFTVERPDAAWVIDITYIRAWQGWLDLAVVLDLYSRKVLGWSMKPTLARDIVLDALLRAMGRADVLEYIELFYNRERQHSHLGGVSPEAFEAASL